MSWANCILVFVVAAAGAFAQPPAQPPAQSLPENLRQAQQLMRQGKRDDAMAIYRQELAANPNSVPANNGMGVLLDLAGRTAEARKYFAKAVEAAPTPQAKAAAHRAMAMSYAFDNDCANTIKHQREVMDYWASQKNFFQQGEMATEGARVCLEAGDFATALTYYSQGRELGLKEPGIKPERVSLWNYRWEHAQARIAARRGNEAEAEKHVAAAKALLDKDPEMAKAQAIFYPYLTGYVAFYTGDYNTALEELQKANQNDPFIQCLIGHTYDKLGNAERAAEYYQKASTTPMHNPPGAYAHWFTRMKRAGNQ